MLKYNKHINLLYLFIAFIVLFSIEGFAHGVDDSTRNFLNNNTGLQIIPFIYIGAKHMVTGYDHLLFLVGSCSSCIAAEMYCCTSVCSPSVTV